MRTLGAAPTTSSHLGWITYGAFVASGFFVSSTATNIASLSVPVAGVYMVAFTVNFLITDIANTPTPVGYVFCSNGGNFYASVNRVQTGAGPNNNAYALASFCTTLSAGTNNLTLSVVTSAYNGNGPYLVNGSSVFQITKIA